jgi:hypothetical protein
MGRSCDTYGDEEKCLQGFGGGKLKDGPLGRPRHRWKNNTKMDHKKNGRVWTKVPCLRRGHMSTLL